MNFEFHLVNEKSVREELLNLGSDSSTDVLGFDSKLLKLSAFEIAPVLCRLFNISLVTSVIPEDWKLAKVTPIFKDKGEKSDMNNYRPISVIGHIPKLLEKQVHKQLLNYFQDHKFISIDQSAYLKHHNTQTALHRVTDDFIDNISCNTFTGVCSFDIKKCFDSIDHDLLLTKMKLYGIINDELKWFESYLYERKQIVKCHNKCSEKRKICVGVPQGSVLGPLLLIIFVNDISQHVGLSKRFY